MDKHVSMVSVSLMFVIPCRVTSQCYRVCITLEARARDIYIVRGATELDQLQL